MIATMLLRSRRRALAKQRAAYGKPKVEIRKLVDEDGEPFPARAWFSCAVVLAAMWAFFTYVLPLILSFMVWLSDAVH